MFPSQSRDIIGVCPGVSSTHSDGHSFYISKVTSMWNSLKLPFFIKTTRGRYHWRKSLGSDGKTAF